MQHAERSEGCLREATLLSAATGAAQVMTLLLAPAILRRYEAQDFGVASLMIGLAGSLGQLSCFKYDVALMTCPQGRAERPLLAASGIAVGGSALLLWVILRSLGTSLLHSLLTMGTVISAGAYTLGSALCLRRLDPALLSRAVILKATVQLAAQLFLSGWRDPVAGLLAASLLSGVSANLALLPAFRLPKGGRWGELRIAAAAYREYPLILLPGTAAFQTAGWLHQSAVLRFDPGLLGCFSAVERLLAAPTAVLSSTVGQLFLRWTSRTPPHRIRRLYDQTSLTLFTAALVFCLAFYAASPMLPVILGEEWRDTGEVLRTMLPLFGARFVAAPVASGLIAAGERRAMACWQCSVLLISSMAVAAAVLTQLSPWRYLRLYRTLMAAEYLALWLLARWAVGREGKPD